MTHEIERAAEIAARELVRRIRAAEIAAKGIPA